jgi:hypothetical protein
MLPQQCPGTISLWRKIAQACVAVAPWRDLRCRRHGAKWRRIAQIVAARPCGRIAANRFTASHFVVRHFAANCCTTSYFAP